MSETLTGIVVAAGRGLRMGRLTADRPKCMLPVAGVPLLVHTARRMRDVGCTRVVAVVGHRADTVSAPGVELVHNPGYQSSNILHSLICARRYMDGPILVSYSDIWLEPEVLSTIAQTVGGLVAGVDVDWTQYYDGRVGHPISEAEKAYIGEHGNVIAIGKHLESTKAGRNTIGEFIGVLKASPAGAQLLLDRFDAVDAALAPDSPFHTAARWREAYLTDMLQDLIDTGADVLAAPIQRGWAELDTAEDLDRLPSIAEIQRLTHLRRLLRA